MYRPSSSVVLVFTTNRGNSNADALPTAAMAKNGVDDGTVTLTVANIDTRRYKVTGTIPSGYTTNDAVAVKLNATLKGVATKNILLNTAINRSLETTYAPGGAFVLEFTVNDGVRNADALPVAKLMRNGVDDTGVTVTVANIDAGRYRVSGTIPSGYTVGDGIAISVNATLDAVVYKIILLNTVVAVTTVTSTTTTIIKSFDGSF